MYVHIVLQFWSPSRAQPRPNQGPNRETGLAMRHCVEPPTALMSTLPMGLSRPALQALLDVPHTGYEQPPGHHQGNGNRSTRGSWAALRKLH